MVMGKFLSYLALKTDRFTTYLPSYGAEVRGGTAHCMVIVSDNEIYSPYITKADTIIAMNEPSLDKFKKELKKGGILILNSDLMSGKFLFNNIRGVSLPLNKIALDCGNIKVANVVALGALLSLDPSIFKKETLVNALKETFKNQNTLNQNLKALDKGKKSV